MERRAGKGREPRKTEGRIGAQVTVEGGNWVRGMEAIEKERGDEQEQEKSARARGERQRGEVHQRKRKGHEIK